MPDDGGARITLDDRVLMTRLRGLPEKLRQRLRAFIVQTNPILAGKVRQKMTNDVLQVHSGKLLASVKNEMVENAHEVFGRVYSHGVPYANIQERGGTTRPHVILPRNAKALRFMMGGRVVFAKKVNHPGSRIPARSTFGASLAEMRQRIIADLKALPKGL